MESESLIEDDISINYTHMINSFLPEAKRTYVKTTCFVNGDMGLGMWIEVW